MPTNPEFIALCRAQVALLTQGLGASLSVVYLMRQLAEGADAQLVPIVVYPESAENWEGQSARRLPPASSVRLEPPTRLLPDPVLKNAALQIVSNPPDSKNSATSLPDRVSLESQRQLVVPLIHQDGVLGLLVVARDDRAWSEWEQTQIEHVADTLALACVLDQRYAWLEHDRQQQQRFQAQQHDRLDNLLHQFRNSLTALKTFGKLILKRLRPGDPNRDLADSLVRETTRLTELSQQLEAVIGAEIAPLALPPAAIDAADPTANSSPLPLLPASGLLSDAAVLLEPCSIEAVLEPLLASARTIAQDRKLTLHTDISKPLPVVSANAQALREVLNNLLENALKYTPAGGHILVEAALAASSVELSISDTGPGIPHQDLPHIFERRFRGVQSQTEIPGSGLGLAIAKALVEQMHGDIQVVSPARSNNLLSGQVEKGPGTTLVVRLPLADLA